MRARRWATRRTCKSKGMAKRETWQLAKQFGEPELVIKTPPYTMAAHGQDVWWDPDTAIPLTEARWVRAVEIRPGSLAGRKITHHAVAYLQQNEPGVTKVDDPNDRGQLMEWAMGKQYDIYRPNAGKLICRARESTGPFTSMR